MIKKGVLVTAIFIFSTLVQLISQILVTRIFGASLNVDIFLAAVALPTIAVTVIYGTLSDAFLPLFGEYKAKHTNQADNYFFSILCVMGLLSGILAVIAQFVSYPVASVLYAERGMYFVQQVALQMKYMSASLPLAVIATLLGSYFYSAKHMIRFPLAQALGSLINVLCIVFFAPSMGTWAMILAFVINIAFQIILVIPNKIFQFRFMPVNITPLLLAWIPLTIGSFASRSDALFIRSFASNLPEGYFVYLNLISKIFSLATGVMTIGIQVLLLPHLVEYIHAKKYDTAIKNVTTAKLVAIGISILVTFALVLIAPFAIKLLFVGGKFTAQDAQIANSLIPFFILPAIGWGINSVFFQPLLALKKQFQLGLVNVVSFIGACIIGITIKSLYGSLYAIIASLTTLLFFGIIGSEVLWHYYKNKLTKL